MAKWDYFKNTNMKFNNLTKLVLGTLLFSTISCGGNTTSNGNAQTANNSSAQVPTENPNNQAQVAQSTNANSAQFDPTAQPSPAIQDFNFYILKSGIKFTKSDLKPGNTYVFVFFDPSCVYCQHEARDIDANFSKFNNTEFMFISMNDPGLMSTFFDNYAKGLNNKDNVHLLYDRDMNFIQKFHIPTQYPATYIYNADGSLKTYWNGTKSAEDMIKAITQ